MGRLIDANALLSKMEKYSDDTARSKNEYLFGMQQRLETCIELVEDAPTVDAVPARHGKWVDENGNRPYGYRFNWLCSECGRPQHTSTAKLLKEFEEEHRWCHFCGARMDGDHHEG